VLSTGTLTGVCLPGAGRSPPIALVSSSPKRLCSTKHGDPTLRPQSNTEIEPTEREATFDFLATSPAPFYLPPENDVRIPTWSANFDMRVPLTERFGVKGEFFMGRNK